MSPVKDAVIFANLHLGKTGGQSTQPSAGEDLDLTSTIDGFAPHIGGSAGRTVKALKAANKAAASVGILQKPAANRVLKGLGFGFSVGTGLAVIVPEPHVLVPAVIMTCTAMGGIVAIVNVIQENKENGKNVDSKIIAQLNTHRDRIIQALPNCSLADIEKTCAELQSKKELFCHHRNYFQYFIEIDHSLADERMRRIGDRLMKLRT